MNSPRSKTYCLYFLCICCCCLCSRSLLSQYLLYREMWCVKRACVATRRFRHNCPLRNAIAAARNGVRSSPSVLEKCVARAFAVEATPLGTRAERDAPSSHQQEHKILTTMFEGLDSCPSAISKPPFKTS
jgi:hypothetical protein